MRRYVQSPEFIHEVLPSPLTPHPSEWRAVYADLGLREEKDIGGEVINESPQCTKSGYCNYCQNGAEGKILKEIR